MLLSNPKLAVISMVIGEDNLASNKGQLNMQRDETLGLAVVAGANFTSWGMASSTPSLPLLSL